ncbi:MAG TPA: hypothetical protein VKU19_05910 [Bryobacteraceae bacterium]|nr:hypothetical protein [Bryobacteraceae bacterium]
MQSSRDSSLLRSLAVAFGDGLAFGVGMKLTQAAGRQLTAPPSSAFVRSDSNPLADRVEQIEQNLKRFERVERPSLPSSGAIDQKVLDAILAAIEARLVEHSGQVERRLTELDARMAIELRSLDHQNHSITKQVSGDIEALHEQMVTLNREFGEAVAQIVAEQVEAQVRAHATALEQSISAHIAVAVESAMEPRLAAVRREVQDSLAAMAAEQESMRQEVRPLEQQLRAELEEKEREITELRQRIADTDTNVLELVLGIGEICRQAAQKILPVASEPPVEAVPGPPEEPAVAAPVEIAGAPHKASPESSAEPEVQKPSRLWRVPLVSSLVLATGGMVLRHFLY